MKEKRAAKMSVVVKVSGCDEDILFNSDVSTEDAKKIVREMCSFEVGFGSFRHLPSKIAVTSPSLSDGSYEFVGGIPRSTGTGNIYL